MGYMTQPQCVSVGVVSINYRRGLPAKERKQAFNCPPGWMPVFPVASEWMCRPGYNTGIE